MTNKRLILGAATSAAALTIGALALAPSARATDTVSVNMPTGCTIEDLYTNSTDFYANADGTRAMVQLHPTTLHACNGLQISLVSYAAPSYAGEGEDLKKQQLIEANTLNVDSAQDVQTFGVQLPKDGCFQLDFIIGEKHNTFANGETYSSERLIDHLNKCVGDEWYPETGGNGGGTVDTGGNTGGSTGGSTIQPGNGGGTVATPVVTTTTVSTPATLPQTGAGLGATGLAGFGAAASGLVAALRQRRRA